MNSYKKFILTILSFVVGFSFGVTFKVLYEATSYKPYEWKNHNPVIVNCYGKDFSKLQMIRAIEYWTLRGQKIGFYEHNPPQSVCDNEWLEGFIILRKSESLKYSETTLASTRRFTTFSIMKGAVINYKPGSFNLNLINEHELGHALGFAHIEIEGHIMHPLYHKMGRDFWIPAK
tara:strand:+ start:151 stop:675 length:525 start_codon:yes stop_codon:yes gene_type:complete